MKRNVVVVMMVMSLCAISVNASTVAWWRFEEGPAGSQVPKTNPGQTWEASTADSSGNGYDLSVWDESGAGYVYRSDVAYSTVPQTGVANNFSVKNSGGGPAMWTETGSGVSTMSPAQWTVEVTVKIENGWHRTIIGRDSFGTNTAGPNPNAELAAFYLQVVPDQGLAVKFCDVSGYWHEAVSATNVIQGFDWGSDPDGANAPWYSIAGVSDGSTLSLYLQEIGATGWQLIAQTDMTLSGSTNTAMTAGAGDGGDWDAGNWTVGRGLYNGGHGDRAYGFIDEVRISDAALAVSEFLVPEPATLLLLGLGSVLAVNRRKK